MYIVMCIMRYILMCILRCFLMCILRCFLKGILMCIKTAGMHLTGSFLFVCEAEIPLLGLAQFPF
jgi:hypothetical protein